MTTRDSSRCPGGVRFAHRVSIGLLLPAVVCLTAMLPRPAWPAERGGVLVLGAHCDEGTCIVDTYGSGSIVRLDANESTAYVLTTRHIARNADRLYVLCDPISVPFEAIYSIEDGLVPNSISAPLAQAGHPVPHTVRIALPPDAADEQQSDQLCLRIESWVLSGNGYDYLLIPQPENLELYHLLPATVVRESDSDLNVALLSVRHAPRFDSDPVIYIVGEDAVANGTVIRTLGCECGAREGIARAEVQGTVVSTSDQFLHYRSSLAHPAFTGGPVFLGDYMIAMNDCENQRPEYPTRARLASTFKEVVDDWIGLPRMKVDLRIQSPEGARDGVVSTGQLFTIRARALPDPDGQVLAPMVTVGLHLPTPFQTADERVRVLSVGDEVGWTVAAPAQVTERQAIRVSDEDPPPGWPSTFLAELPVATEEGAHLTAVVVEGPPNDATLYMGEDFTVALQFEQSGPPVGSIDGQVSIDVSSGRLESLDGLISQNIEIGRPLRWRLRPRESALAAPVSFAVNVNSLDRNGKTIGVTLPDPIRVRVERERRFKFRVGMGAVFPEDTVGAEMRVGIQYRVTNVMHRGMPLLLGAVAGTGFSDYSVIKAEDVLPDSLQYYLEGEDIKVLDYRYYFGANVALGFGPAEISFEAGEMNFRTWVTASEDELPTEPYEKEPSSSTYMQWAIEVNLWNLMGLMGGIRTFSDAEPTEYFVNLMLR